MKFSYFFLLGIFSLLLCVGGFFVFHVSAQSDSSACTILQNPELFMSDSDIAVAHQLEKASSEIAKQLSLFSAFTDDTLARKNVPTSDLVSLIVNRMDEFENDSNDLLLENMNELMESDSVTYLGASEFMNMASSQITDALETASHAVRFAIASDVEVERSREVIDSAASLHENALPLIDSMLRSVDSLMKFNNNFPCTCDRCT